MDTPPNNTTVPIFLLQATPPAQQHSPPLSTSTLSPPLPLQQYGLLVRDGDSLVVSMSGFRSHDNLRCTFPLFKSTYVKGPNGAGKTDIYEAIKWAFAASGEDEPHPVVKTRQEVFVHVQLGKYLSVLRNNTKTSPYVEHNQRKYQGAEADAILSSLLGSRRVYEASIYLTSDLHPFIRMTGPQRMELITELVGDENVRKEIAERILSAKHILTAARELHIKEEAVFGAVHNTNNVREDVILSPGKMAELQAEHSALIAQIPRLREMTFLLSSAKDKEQKLLKELSTLPPVISPERLREMQRQCALYKAYTPVQKEVAQLEAQIKQQPSISPELVTQQNYNKALLNEQMRAKYYYIVNKYGVAYQQLALTNRLARLKEIVSLTDVLSTSTAYNAARIAVTNTRALLGPGELPPLSTFLEQQAALSLSLQHANVWEKHEEIKQILSSLPPGVDSVSVQAEISRHNFLSSCVWIFAARRKYIAMWEMLVQTFNTPTLVASPSTDIPSLTPTLLAPPPSTLLAPPSPPSWYTILKQPEQVSARIESLKSTRDAILRSKEVQNCPHCEKPLHLQHNRIVAYTGEVVSGDVAAIATEIQQLSALFALPFPAVPPGAVEREQKEINDAISLNRNLLSKLERLALLQKQTPALPPNYVHLPNASAHSLTIITKTIEAYRSYIRASEHLASLGPSPPAVPDALKTIQLSDIPKYKAELAELQTVEVIDVPHSSQFLSVHLALKHKRETLATLEIPKERIEDSAIFSAQSAQSRREFVERELTQAQAAISANKGAEEEKWLAEAREGHITAALSLSAKEIQKKTALFKLQQVSLQHEQASNRYDSLLELQTICDVARRESAMPILSELQNSVNVFLAAVETPIRVHFEATERIVIACYKKGVRYGEVKNLSTGERRLVSVAIALAFVVRSDCPFVIVDETMNGLSPDNKQVVTNMFLDVTNLDRESLNAIQEVEKKYPSLKNIAGIIPKVKKTLILTDHHCTYGHFWNVISLPDRNR